MLRAELSFEIVSNDFRGAGPLGFVRPAEHGLEEGNERIRILVELVVERTIRRKIARAIKAVKQQPPGDRAVPCLRSQRKDHCEADAGACPVEHFTDQRLRPLATDAL
ncbi:hypothetical protein [Bradyrhizobium sp.]|uniref:hypothetical protein n=1 Tax=Bradyrhizobium sp. TaxID=376 RepID=UPI0025BE3A1E|nr:hypothetical protein [Bradyrhizobium sp.]MBV8921112.1 hypothetical protein [Bradyrhizobium sp.]